MSVLIIAVSLAGYKKEINYITELKIHHLVQNHFLIGLYKNHHSYTAINAKATVTSNSIILGILIWTFWI